MIDFELPDEIKEAKDRVHALAEGLFRKIARYYDVHEHEPVKEVEQFSEVRRGGAAAGGAASKNRALTSVVLSEELAWGDAGITLAMPSPGLGGAAIQAVATPEQKEKFGHLSAAMAITEPGCGSDSAAITTTARLDPETNEWVINGEKIFVTGGRRHPAVVVWATLDRSKGRPAIKSFVVEKDRPGVKMTKLEHKLGIRASDTADFVFEDCRVPYDHILGSPEIKPTEGFKGVMKTFDATRPTVAALAIGVARAALDFTKDVLEGEGYDFRYDIGVHKLSAIQKEVMEMESHLEVARLLTWRAATMLDKGQRNSLEASMAKAKAGRAATYVCQKCVELLGPKGYSCEWLVEKWMRDCKINDIFEGTGQIQMLIIARNILGFSREQLK